MLALFLSELLAIERKIVNAQEQSISSEEQHPTTADESIPSGFCHTSRLGEQAQKEPLEAQAITSLSEAQSWDCTMNLIENSLSITILCYQRHKIILQSLQC